MVIRLVNLSDPPAGTLSTQVWFRQTGLESRRNGASLYVGSRRGWMRSAARAFTYLQTAAIGGRYAAAVFTSERAGRRAV